MMKISLTISRPPDVGLRKWKECTKAGHAAMGQYWHKNYLPDHFTRAARTKYGHQARRPKYLRNKERGGTRSVNGRVVQIKYGGQVDNVFSGEMETLVRSPALIQAFPSRATVKMVGPRYVSMRPYKSGQPDKGAEISRVIPDQQRVLEKVLGEETHRRFVQWKQPRTITI